MTSVELATGLLIALTPIYSDYFFFSSVCNDDIRLEDPTRLCNHMVAGILIFDRDRSLNFHHTLCIKKPCAAVLGFPAAVVSITLFSPHIWSSLEELENSKVCDQIIAGRCRFILAQMLFNRNHIMKRGSPDWASYVTVFNKIYTAMKFKNEIYIAH